MATHSYLSFSLSCIFLIFLLQSFVTETSASRPSTLPLSSLVVHGVQAARIAAAHVIRRPLDIPLHSKRTRLEFRDDGDDDGDDWPVFPAEPPSCSICESNYANIDHCAEACPIFANFSMIMFNPGAFVDVIECACTDTFQSTYPQCVDCFVQTNQTQFLNVTADDTPSILQGIRNVCSIASVILGHAASADGEVPPSSSSAPPIPTSTSRAVSLRPLSVKRWACVESLFLPAAVAIMFSLGLSTTLSRLL